MLADILPYALLLNATADGERQKKRVAIERLQHHNSALRSLKLFEFGNGGFTLATPVHH